MARSSMDAWRPLDRSSSQAWARMIDFRSFWSTLASGGAITCAVPFGFGVHGISIERRFPFGCFSANSNPAFRHGDRFDLLKHFLSGRFEAFR